MNEPANSVKLEIGSVTDRGLNPKRPLNEDSLLEDPSRNIFAVADGVGGAEAGEVASKTAIEVLGEAFRHQTAGADIEDLMELAIQRANSSIHKLSTEHRKLSMMATTIVALHLDGHRATIGHVGDSRLYRLTPDGKLHRETADHSIVEEEVRAGRMTPEQAANHPSKNVISRALGAEPAVEVDMRILEVADGTTFLLCTDGITRHLPDPEIRELLNADQEANKVCAEMKRRCHERGAEDNLTAVIVRVGVRTGKSLEPKLDRTLSIETTAVAAVAAPQTRLTPPSRIAFPQTEPKSEVAQTATATPASKSSGKSSRKSGGLRFLLFLLFIGAVAGAFYGGVRYQQRMQAAVANTAVATPTPAPEMNLRAEFESKRNAVDVNPQQWVTDHAPAGTSNEERANALAAKDAETIYLYGRALMLTGNHRDAMAAFEAALGKARTESPAKLSLEAETRLAAAAAALRLKNQDTALSPLEARQAEEKAMRLLEEGISIKTATPAP
ncbi:MAG: family protein phosphatase [Blastocatellia bacterium]|jgi:protein phosphatase|nr:family protein phosphatase [Blastocatellia bacterium]